MLKNPVRKMTDEEKEYGMHGENNGVFTQPEVILPMDYTPSPLTRTDISALQTAFYSAGVDIAKEHRITEEIRERENIMLDSHCKKLKMKQIASEYKEDQKDLKNLRVYIELDKIKVAVKRQNGTLSTPKNLVDEHFVSAKKIVARKPDECEMMILEFVKKGTLITVMYSSKAVRESKHDLIQLLKAQGVTVNVSRRTRSDVEEELFFLFENIAEKVEVPFTFGFYKAENEKWHYAKPGDVTYETVLEAGGEIDA